MTEEIKKIVRKYFETVWNEGDPSAVDEILAEGYVAHIANISSAIRGVEQFKQFITKLQMPSTKEPKRTRTFI